MSRSVACLLSCLLVCSVVTAEEEEKAPDPAVERLAAEMGGIRETLDRLVTLLETSVYHQRVELVLRRIQLKESRLEPLGRRVTNAEDEVFARQSEIEQLNAMLEEQHELIREQLRSGVEPAPDDQQMVDEVEMHLKIMTEELTEVRLRLQEHTIDLERRRDEIEVLDELLSDLLDD